MEMVLRKGFVLLLVAGFVATGCSKKAAAPVPAPAPPAANSGTDAGNNGGTAAGTIQIPAANMKATKSVAGAKSVEIEADTEGGVNYYSPTVLTGTAGQKITLELKDHSTTVPHNFTLAEQNLNVDLNPGETKTVTVTFPQSGVLQFHCEYHVSTGMIGELTVA